MPVRLTFSLIALAVCAPCTLAQSHAAHKLRSVIGVCDLLREPGKYEGQMIRVRGQLRSSGSAEHPSFDELDGAGCASNEQEEKWVVSIVSPDAHFLAQSPKGYRPDRRSVERVSRLVTKQVAAGRVISSVECTIEGLFYGDHTRDDGEHAVRPRRHPRYDGHVVIQAIRNPVVLR